MNLFFDNRHDWEAAITSGLKVHTVRKFISRIRPGSPLTMITNRYTGRRTIARQTCTRIQAVTVANGAVRVDGNPIAPETFARNGGFDNADEMFAYYGNLDGYLIHWTDLEYK